MAKKNEVANEKDAMEAVDTVLETAAAAVGAVVEQPSAAAEDKSKAAVTNKSGFYIYIGPNIKGLIQTGSIYRGDRESAYKAAAAAIEKHPKVKTLIVAGDVLPEVRLKVKTPGNVLYANYNVLKNPAGK